MRTLPFLYYVFESKYGEVIFNLPKKDMLEYKTPKFWKDETEEQSKFKFIEG
jgi:hypothetical protein